MLRPSLSRGRQEAGVGGSPGFEGSPVTLSVTHVGETPWCARRCVEGGVQQQGRSQGWDGRSRAQTRTLTGTEDLGAGKAFLNSTQTRRSYETRLGRWTSSK